MEFVVGTWHRGLERAGEPMHSPAALAASLNTRMVELDAHINDPAFAEAALVILDDWVLQGHVPRGFA